MAVFKLSRKIGLAFVLFASSGAMALSSNDIQKLQECQGLIDFVIIKTDEVSGIYDKENLASIRKGLSIYNNFIQKNVITPRILEYSGGDKVKAELMQLQVDDFKNAMVDKLNDRYPQKKMLINYAEDITDSTNQSVPKGDDLLSLKAALKTIVKLSKN